MLVKRRIKNTNTEFLLRFNPHTGHGSLVGRNLEEVRKLLPCLRIVKYTLPDNDVRLTRAIKKRGQLEAGGCMLTAPGKVFFYFNTMAYYLLADLKSMQEDMGYEVDTINKLGRAFT